MCTARQGVTMCVCECVLGKWTSLFMTRLHPPGSTWRCEEGHRLHAAADVCVCVGDKTQMLIEVCVDVDTSLFGFVDGKLICCRPTGHRVINKPRRVEVSSHQNQNRIRIWIPARVGDNYAD